MSEPQYKGTDKHGIKIWQLRPSQGVKVDGKYVRHCETFHGTKAEARKRLRELEGLADAGVSLSGGRIGFEEYAGQWLEERARKVAPRTFKGYERETKRLCQILGSAPLADINAPTVRKTLEAARAGIKGGNGSENSLKATFRVLSMILGQAAKDDLILVNPCTKVDAPHEKPRERRALDKAQYGNFLKMIDEAEAAEYARFDAKEERLRETGHQNKERHALRGIHDLAFVQAARIAHATGMRPSEILALQWKHIDLPHDGQGCISVCQATATAEGGVKETKTARGKRPIYIDEHTKQALARWRRFQQGAANKLGMELGASSWVICTDVFTQANQNNLGRWWRSWLEGTEFEGWVPYELRHTQATLLMNCPGISPQSVCDRMGHSSLAVTQIYTHRNDDAQRRLADMLTG